MNLRTVARWAAIAIVFALPGPLLVEMFLAWLCSDRTLMAGCGLAVAGDVVIAVLLTTPRTPAPAPSPAPEMVWRPT
jgi:hypothetical protein